MFARSYTLILSSLAISLLQSLRIHARALSPNPNPNPRFISSPFIPIQARQDAAAPTFPSDPPSCPKCEQSFRSINSCAAAAPVLANVSMIIFNPGAFIDVIKCACTDTFQAAYPQCVDCFTRTNQTEFLSADSDQLPGIISGIRSICAIESTLLGNVSATNGEVPSSSASDAAALPTDGSSLTSSTPRGYSFSGLGFGNGWNGLLVGLVLGFTACLV
ncbi:hypothetical protein ACEPAI_2133 [Sanghuangporus weigelae]